MSRPNTSSVEQAMHAAAAAEEILQRHPYNAPEIATYLGTIIDATRALAAYQAEDVLAHVHYRAKRIDAQSPYVESDDGRYRYRRPGLLGTEPGEDPTLIIDGEHDPDDPADGEGADDE